MNGERMRIFCVPRAVVYSVFQAFSSPQIFVCISVRTPCNGKSGPSLPSAHISFVTDASVVISFADITPALLSGAETSYISGLLAS